MGVKLDDKTTIPVWIVFVSIPTFIGAIAWVTFLAAQVSANTKDIDSLKNSDDAQVKEVKTMREENFKLMIEIQKDLAVIKAKLNERR